MSFNNERILSNTSNDNPHFPIAEDTYLLQYPLSINCIIIFSQTAFFFSSSTSATLSEPNKLLSHSR